jgi:enoyl-CoA hydratase/carnithine racemase
VTAPLRIREADGVFEIELVQPPLNEIGTAMLAALEDCLTTIERSSARALIVHSGQERGFCAGADLRELYAGMLGRSPADFIPELRSTLARIHVVMNRIDRLAVTTIGALHGVCFGGGFELALACDVLVADRTTRFGFPELRLGIIPCFGGIPRLRREVPNAVVRDLVLTGRTFSAKRAHELGLVSQLVAAGEALTVARATARQVALFDRSVMQRAKGFIKPLPEAELAEEQELFLSLAAEPRLRAALADFVSRSDPQPYLPSASALREGGA